MGSTTLERLEVLARKLDFNEDAEYASDVLETFRNDLTHEEEFTLISWIGYETPQLNFQQIARELNVEEGEVRRYRDNAVAHLKELIARKRKGSNDD